MTLVSSVLSSQKPLEDYLKVHYLLNVPTIKHEEPFSKVSSMLFSKLYVSVQVSLPHKDTDSNNATNVYGFRDLDRNIIQILFSLLQDFHASTFLTSTPFSMLSIYALKQAHAR